MTRTEELTLAIQSIYLENKDEIDKLPIKGPKGGTNADKIYGWINHGVAVVTQAANLSDMPVLPYWSGWAPTPASSIPLCVYDEIMSAWCQIFNGIKK